MDFDKIPTIDQLQTMDNDSEMVLIPELAAEEQSRASGDHFPTGFSVFDEVMKGGIAGGDLVIISGRTGQGKTTFAQTINYHLSQEGIPVAWFSYEIPIRELWEKFQAMGIKAEGFLAYAPKPNKSGKLAWIKKKIMETTLKHNTQVVFIDHLGFLTPDIDETNARDFDQNYSSYLGQLTRQLKTLAMENNIIIVLLAHTRKTKDNLDVEDIAHSVGIPQEADFVFMVERLKVKTTKKWQVDSEPEGDVYTPFSRISLQKNRRTGLSKYVKVELRDGRLQEAKIYDGQEPVDISVVKDIFGVAE